jgi:hypothetical protein
MDLHMRLVGAQDERLAQQRLCIRKLALIFADQAQELQSVRLAGIGGKHLRQNLFGLPPLALLNQVGDLRDRRGQISFHDGSILKNLRPVFPIPL